MYEIIKITKKRNSNYNLYIKDYRDEKIEIHLDILYSYALYKNYEIDDDTFAQMLIENEKKLAKQRVLKILATANKTKKEIILKLRERKFSKDAIDSAIKFVDEYNFVNEENIAQNLVEGSYSRKKYSKRAMVSKLRQKGIESSIIENTVSLIDDDTEYKNALYFAEKKIHSISDEDIYKVKRKLISALSYRGFSYDIIQKVTKEVLKSYQN